MNSNHNARKFVLVRHPVGTPSPADFELVETQLGSLELGNVRVQTMIWGIDPGLRNRLSGVAGYAAGLQPGDAISGFVAGRVSESTDSVFRVGDIVTGTWGWRDRADVPAQALCHAPELGGLPIESLLGLMGIPGITAYFGMVDVAQVKRGDQVLVTSAAGGVGSIASQIAQAMGARVVGVAGGEEKCEWLRRELGLDQVIDYKSRKDMCLALCESFPDGIDVVFENTGNVMVDTVLPQMRIGGRIVICGQTADYNLPQNELHGIRNTSHIISRRLRIQGLLAMDYADKYEEARSNLRSWFEEGKLQTKEHVVSGFEKLPQAFCSLFTENAIGRKLVVA